MEVGCEEKYLGRVPKSGWKSSRYVKISAIMVMQLESVSFKCFLFEFQLSFFFLAFKLVVIIINEMASTQQ